MKQDMPRNQTSVMRNTYLMVLRPQKATVVRPEITTSAVPRRELACGSAQLRRTHTECHAAARKGLDNEKYEEASAKLRVSALLREGPVYASTQALAMCQA